MRTKDKNVSIKIVKIAHKLFGKANIKNVSPAAPLYIKKHKIAVFVPLKNADELTFAMASAGAGIIGNYTVCSFRISGIGTFLGGEGSKPKAGKKGKFEMTEELRLEMICDTHVLDNVIDEIYRVHPYEEPAYEVYDVKVRSKNYPADAALVKLKKRTALKDVFKKFNYKVDIQNLPAKIRNIKIKQAVLDYSGKDDVNTGRIKERTLFIKKSKGIINIELNK